MLIDLGKIVIVNGDDEDSSEQLMDVELALDAILRIGGLPASRRDLKPGMQVPLEFGRGSSLKIRLSDDGRTIRAINV